MASNGQGITDPAVGQAVTESKGKGKAVAEDDEMKDVGAETQEDDDDEEEEEEEDDDANEDNEEDDLNEINPENVVSSRTRGRVIDFAKAAAENPAEDEDEDDDDDFEDPDAKMDED